MTLYEISEEYKTFLDMVETGEIPEEAVGDTLEAIQGEFNEKADNVACMIKNLLAEADALKVEKSALDSREKSKRAKADRMKTYLSESMKKLGIWKLETARNALSFRKSTSLYIQDEEDFKQRHMDLCKKEIVITIPKSEITKLLKSNEEISGAELRENQNLQIK